MCSSLRWIPKRTARAWQRETHHQTHSPAEASQWVFTVKTRSTCYMLDWYTSLQPQEGRSAHVRSAPHQSPAGLLFIFNTKNNHNHTIRKHRNINATLRLPARTPADESPAAANGKEERVSTQPARAGRGGGARAVTASSSSHRLFCCVNVLNYVVVASCRPT